MTSELSSARSGLAMRFCSRCLPPLLAAHQPSCRETLLLVNRVARSKTFIFWSLQSFVNSWQQLPHKQHCQHSCFSSHCREEMGWCVNPSRASSVGGRLGLTWCQAVLLAQLSALGWICCLNQGATAKIQSFVLFPRPRE